MAVTVTPPNVFFADSTIDICNSLAWPVATSTSLTVLVSYPTEEIISVYFFPMASVSVKLPSTPEIAPLFDPSNFMDAPTTGSFFALNTLPLSFSFCEKLIKTNPTRAVSVNRSLFIEFNYNAKERLHHYARVNGRLWNCDGSINLMLSDFRT